MELKHKKAGCSRVGVNRVYYSDLSLPQSSRYISHAPGISGLQGGILVPGTPPVHPFNTLGHLSD